MKNTHGTNWDIASYSVRNRDGLKNERGSNLSTALTKTTVVFAHLRIWLGATTEKYAYVH